VAEHAPHLDADPWALHPTDRHPRRLHLAAVAEEGIDCGGRSGGAPTQNVRTGKLGRVVWACRRWRCATCGPQQREELLEALAAQADPIAGVWHLVGPLDAQRRVRMSTQARRRQAGVLRVVLDDQLEHFVASRNVAGRGPERMDRCELDDVLADLDEAIAGAAVVFSKFSGTWERPQRDRDVDVKMLRKAASVRAVFRAGDLLPDIARIEFGVDLRLGESPVGISAEVAADAYLRALAVAEAQIAAEADEGAGW
jgi:hypothetical protein